MFRLRVTGLNQGMGRSLAFEKGFKLAVAKALSLEARRILDDANQIAPFIQGKLQQTATVEPPVIAGNIISVTAGYPETGGMIRQLHENPRAGQTRGLGPQGQRYAPGSYATSGESQFLTKAIAKNLSISGFRIANDVQAMMRFMRLK